MKARLAVVLCLLTLLTSCDALFFNIPELPVTPQPTPSPTPIVLPSRAPLAHMFGIAFSPVASFQPLTDTLRYNDQVARLCYEGLFELDEAFIPQPLLCTAMTTEDNIHFAVTLREGILFHDGSPLTADDVVYSINLAKTPGGPYANRLTCVQSVAAQTDGTVAITMNTAVWNAAALFDFPVVRQSGAAVAPGTGPYRMVLNAEGSYLLPSPGWWQSKTVPVGRIDLIDTENTDTLVYSFQYGYIGMTPIDTWDTFSPGINSGYEKVSVPSPYMQYIGVNTARKPLDQPGLRLALALSLDRRGVVEAVYGTDAHPSVLPVPPSSALYSEKSNMRTRFDPGEAKLLISSLGYTGRLELDMIVAVDNSARVQMAEACAESFRIAGFAVNVRTLEWTDFETALSEGDFDLYYAEVKPSPAFNPREFLLAEGSFSYGGYDSAAARDALSLLEQTDPYTGEGIAALEAVWDCMFEDNPILTVCFRDTSFISQRGVLNGQTPTFYNAYYHFSGWTVKPN